MSDTPRTDALMDVTSPIGFKGQEMVDLCRELEVSLSEGNAKAEAQHQRAENLFKTLSYVVEALDELFPGMDEAAPAEALARKVAKRVTAERAYAAACTALLREAREEWPSDRGSVISEFCCGEKETREAWKPVERWSEAVDALLAQNPESEIGILDAQAKEDHREVIEDVQMGHAVGTKQPTLDEFDKGPWTAGKAGAYVESEDFEHDARLNISGDFESHDARYAYACALAATLNRRTSQVPKQEPQADARPDCWRCMNNITRCDNAPETEHKPGCVGRFRESAQSIKSNQGGTP